MVLKYSEFHACNVNQTETSEFARAKTNLKFKNVYLRK